MYTQALIKSKLKHFDKGILRMIATATVECDRKLAFAVSQHENWLRDVTSRKLYVE
jgi:hypothetical protein